MFLESRRRSATFTLKPRIFALRNLLEKSENLMLGKLGEGSVFQTPLNLARFHVKDVCDMKILQVKPAS